jgi:membrane protein implicated in regulation of membrane protease activity
MISPRNLLTVLAIALAVVAVALDNQRLTWAVIALLVVVLAWRMVDRRRRRREMEQQDR